MVGLRLTPCVSCVGLQVLAEDRVRDAITEFVSSQLGEEFANSPGASMQDVYGDMDNKTPCIFILSQVRRMLCSLFARNLFLITL